jgi:hypothetical protein
MRSRKTKNQETGERERAGQAAASIRKSSQKSQRAKNAQKIQKDTFKTRPSLIQKNSYHNFTGAAHDRDKPFPAKSREKGFVRKNSHLPNGFRNLNHLF